jgi:cobalt/nickel transport system ATP-binding protein
MPSLSAAAGPKAWISSSRPPARKSSAARPTKTAHRLSGGEKRLASLATVLAMQPDVLLDEPTNALDEAHRARLIEILKGLNIAMAIVSHDQDFLGKLASRAVLLSEGRLKPTAVHRHAHSHDHLHVHGADHDHIHPHPERN